MDESSPSQMPRHSVSVAAAIFDESGHKVLLIERRDNGHWEPPGGVLELEEAIEDGLRREVYEETGATISVDTLTGVYKNLDRGIVALVFRCTLESSFQASSKEATRIAWWATSAIDQLIPEAYSVRLSDAAPTRERVSIRSHHGTHLVRTNALLIPTLGAFIRVANRNTSGALNLPTVPN